ncbi:MAG: hypothetical protein MJZ57_00150 [Bacteroidales bacterium]|nr:hypothetical protein [Bacteroidales bacterium]
MIRKNTFFIAFILLIFSNMLFAQTENPYMSFNPSSLKENAKYTRNFAPNNYDEKILYNCMTDMVNMARQEYRFLETLKHDVRLDSTAQFQADYQASKDEKTEDNVAPYRTLYYRLKKYDCAGNGAELIAKAKAYLGETEYSYYDLCLALIQSVLKNVKTADVLLDKQFTYFGFGYNTDVLMKSMYVSFVLGNDRTFNNYKPAIGEKDVPFTKTQAGFKSYDDKICKKCAAEPALEVLSDYVSIRKDGSVYITCDDYKGLKKLIGKEGDAIAIDFVQHSQYDCENGNVDYDLSHRGFVTKPITYEKMMELNENANLKSGKLIAKLTDLPEGIDLNSDLDIHILVLKEGNRICRTIIPKAVETKNAAYDEKINFLKDETSIKSKGEWVAAQETGDFSVSFPYQLKKTDYTTAAFDSLVKAVDVPEYTVNKIEIIAHNSPNYYKDANYQKIQLKRADFLKKDVIAHYPGVEVVVSYDYCWEKFKKDIVNNGEYYDLSFLTLDEAARQLKADSWAIKTLDSGYLAPCRYYEIKYYVTYPIETKAKEETFAVWKFNQALAEKNKGLAMSIENYMMQQVEMGNYSASQVDEMNIPMKKEYQAMLNNRLYMKYYVATKMSEPISTEMYKVFNLNPTNVLLTFNTAVCDVFQAQLKSTADIMKTQASIDKLYTVPGMPKEKVNSLNMEYQLKVVNYLDTAQVNTETTALSVATFAKIKEIRNPKMDSWQNAYKLASYFVKKYDYAYALSLMDPFLDDPTISEDFIFSYVSMRAHREETYLSSLFTKAVKIAAEKNPARLCGLFDKLPYCVLENEEVKAIVCKTCNR